MKKPVHLLWRPRPSVSDIVPTAEVSVGFLLNSYRSPLLKVVKQA